MISNVQNFLSFALSESKNIFQEKFSKKNFQKDFLTIQKNFPERAVANYLSFVDATNKIITGGGSREEAQEDERHTNSYYPSA